MSQNWNPGQPPAGGGGFGGSAPSGAPQANQGYGPSAGAAPGGYGGPPGPAGGPGGYGQPPGAPGGYGAPPSGGYGAPPPGGYGAPGPYGASAFGPSPDGGMTPAIVGSLPLGFCAGFFGGCIGFGLVFAIAKGPETKKGATIGFVAQIALGVVFRIIGAAMN